MLKPQPAAEKGELARLHAATCLSAGKTAVVYH